MSTVNEFCIYVTEQLQERGWSDSLLAQRAGMTPSAVSRVLSGERGVTCNWTISVAQALDMDPVWALRLADILPDVPPSIAEEQEVVRILRSLPPVQRGAALLMLYGLSGAAVGRPKAEAVSDARQSSERETIQLDKPRQSLVKLLYQARGLPVPDGTTVLATAELVDILLDEIESHERATDLLLEYFFAVTPRAVRGRLVEKFARAAEDQPERDCSNQ